MIPSNENKNEYIRPRNVTLIINYFEHHPKVALKTIVEHYKSIQSAMEGVETLRKSGIEIGEANYGLYEMHRAERPIDLKKYLIKNEKQYRFELAQAPESDESKLTQLAKKLGSIF